ncbi:MAG: LuxR C-terminal-related transcriptional regulator, partial [Chloroflexota bacterium]|nr:LuxR C-terminal-related transcriptional regulator [Chloroflexota bacterium]
STLLPLLEHESGATRLNLRRLSPDALQALVTARYALSAPDSARLVGYLHTRADGNAVFTIQLLRALEEGDVLRPDNNRWVVGDLEGMHLPLALRQVIDGRLSRLGEEEQRLLRLATVIGHEVAYAPWATVAGVDEDVLLTVVGTAGAALIMIENSTGTGATFTHALVREALYAGVRPSQRRRWHRTIAEVLAAEPHPDPDAVAYHFQQAGDARALAWLIKAGERAQAAYAWVMAAARFERALALMAEAGASAMERGWLLVRASRLLQFFDSAKARALAEEAVPLAQSANDRALAAFARFQCGLMACFEGDVTQGIPGLQAGAAAMAALSETERAHYRAHAPTIGSGAHIPEGRGTVVMWRSYVGPFPEVRALGEALVAEAAGGDEAAIQRVKDGYWGLGTSYAVLGMPDEAGAMYTIAHDAFVRAGNYTVAALTSWYRLELLALPYRADDLRGRRHLAEQAEREHRRASGALTASVPPRFLSLSLLLADGAWEEAERIAAGVSVAEEALIHYTMIALRHLATLALRRGDTARAWEAVRKGLPAGSATEPGSVVYFDVVTTLQRVAAALAMAAGDLPTAHRWLDAHDRWLAWSGGVLGQAEGQTLWGDYYRGAGDGAMAHGHAERALAHAATPRQPLALIAAHRLLAELATDARRFDDAVSHLTAALALADACAVPYERALTLLSLAQLRVATDAQETVPALLAEVRGICVRLNAMPCLALADHLEAQLTPARPIVPTYPVGLTPREVEVLHYLAAGRTNREIAAALFLSERTINVHVTHILTKTNSENRAAAVAFALRHGLV